MVSVCLVVSGVWWCAVVNGSLDLAAREIVLQAFLFDLATIDAAKKFTVQQQMNRAKGARVMYTASKLGPHTQTDRGTCPGVGL